MYQPTGFMRPMKIENIVLKTTFKRTFVEKEQGKMISQLRK